MRRLLQRMLGLAARRSLTAPLPPPPISADEVRQREAAQRRMTVKWRATDRLLQPIIDAYAHGDGVLRQQQRRPPRRGA